MSAAAPGRASRGDSFLTRLEALADRHYQHRHPFNALMQAGRLDIDDLRLWVANRYHYQTRGPIKDALIVAKSEDAAFRRRWVRRVIAHDGVVDPGEPGAAPGGLELWQRLGTALGLSEHELSSGAYLLPEVRVACDEYVEGVRAADLVTAVAFSLTERFVPRLMQARLSAWLQYYAFVDERALDYFKQRVAHAQRHASNVLAFVQANAITPESERCCLDAFAAKCAVSWRLLDAVYLARRSGSVPYIERRVWLMRLSSLAAEDATGQSGAPGVLMGPERALSLNRTAYDLLERCDGRRTLARIMLELAERHAAPLALVERDVATFVAELERRRILAFRAHPV